MKQEDFLGVDGFKDKMASKLYANIKDKLATATVQQLLVGSNIIGRGFGEKKIAKIFQEYPNILEERNIDKLASIQGFSQKTASEFIQNIPRFIEFLKDININTPSNKMCSELKPNSITSVISGKNVVVTGFRDKTLDSDINTRGGNISGTVSKNTFALIVKSKEDNSSTKYMTAEKLGIPIYTVDEFREKFIYN